jgi:membrane fusion protein (multidrug efflux system)
MRKSLFIVLIIVVLVVLSAVAVVHYKESRHVSPQPGKTTVSVTSAKKVQWQRSLQAIGALKASQGIILKAETGGRITKINFKSGDMVKHDDILITLNNLIQKGKLNYAKAQYALTQITYQRDSKLFEKSAISQEALDQAKADMDSQAAEVEQAQGEYDETIIRAPFDGRLGLRNISIGDYINTGDTLVNLQDIDPLYVDFAIPEKYLDIVKKGELVTIAPNASAHAGRTYDGKLTSYETVIDADTGTIMLRSEVANSDAQLLPGGYVEVTFYFGEQLTPLVVPQTAIVSDETHDYVYVLADDNTVKKVDVTIGSQIDQDITVSKGLKAGDKVVSAGTNKIHDGSAVSVSQSQQ